MISSAGPFAFDKFERKYLDSDGLASAYKGRDSAPPVRGDPGFPKYIAQARPNSRGKMSGIPGPGIKTPAAAGRRTARFTKSRQQIFPQSVSGTFRNIKWALLSVGMLLYYFLPFLRWDRGPDQPSQAVLVDLDAMTILLLRHRDLAAGSLLHHRPADPRLLHPVPDERGGRAHLVRLSLPADGWTDLFLLIERWTQGDRRDRMKKAKQPWTLKTVAETILKHSLWLMIAWWTGGAWVLYFADAPTLVKQLATFQAPAQAYIWIASSPPAPMSWPASPASRSASTCAHGRASRRR